MTLTRHHNGTSLIFSSFMPSGEVNYKTRILVGMEWLCLSFGIPIGIECVSGGLGSSIPLHPHPSRPSKHVSAPSPPPLDPRALEPVSSARTELERASVLCALWATERKKIHFSAFIRILVKWYTTKVVLEYHEKLYWAKLSKYHEIFW